MATAAKTKHKTAKRDLLVIKQPHVLLVANIVSTFSSISYIFANLNQRRFAKTAPGEQTIARAIREAGLPLIAIIPRGFGPYFKPKGQYFDACAAGHLLMLSPFPEIKASDALTRNRCFGLNTVAAAICGNDPATIRYQVSRP